MQEKIKQHLQNVSVEQWRDTRLWGLVIFGVVVVLASWSGMRVIETNYELQKKIAALAQQNQITQLQNENQRLQNEYYETDTYLELAARRQYGKGAPGERLLLVPRDAALTYAPPLPSTPELERIQPPKESDVPGYLKNLRAWRDFIFGHKLQ